MKTTLQIIVAAVLVVMLAALADLLPFWMPDMAEMAVLTVASVLLLVWVGFVMQEGKGDERELVHRMNAGRVAYLSGIGVLTLALIVQGFSHKIDPWIAGALGTMVVLKLATRLYLERNS